MKTYYANPYSSKVPLPKAKSSISTNLPVKAPIQVDSIVTINNKIKTTCTVLELEKPIRSTFTLVQLSNGIEIEVPTSILNIV